jgi:transcriptional regulator with XRE-family HTH domain
MQRLEEIRKRKGWSQSKLSEESGVSQTYISELEAGKKQPTVTILKKLSKALNVPITDFFE